ncbi:hypothetical protein LDDCCGHA_1343 [Methylobacterium oxalidis]|nr:hypothetical protein LDDCCGHA_1343 [Methylobacterium oxalidis]
MIYAAWRAHELRIYNVTENAQGQSPDFVELAADIVSAYVTNNSLPVAELPALIASVHAALNGLATGAPQATAEEVAEKATPSQIRKSITPDALVSFIDGKPYKTLKRHLAGHGLDPHTYRQRYGLPSDYPMVAASYAAQRSELAKAIGLGRPGARTAEAEEAPKSRGRRKAA